MNAKASSFEPKDFLWHLIPPWRDRFEHCHWWPPDPQRTEEWKKVPFIAAAWEVFRRHPAAKVLHDLDCCPDSRFEAFIQSHGLGAWPNLADRCIGHDAVTEKERQCVGRSIRREWREAMVELPAQRGFDPRPVYSVTAQSVDLESGISPEAALVLDPELAKTDDFSRSKLENARHAQEAEIARLAVEHYQAGRILIAIEPDTANLDDACNALVACYKQHRVPAEHGRGRPKDWLGVIGGFEKGELKRLSAQIRDDQRFVRYRRIVNGWSWPRR